MKRVLFVLMLSSAGCGPLEEAEKLEAPDLIVAEGDGEEVAPPEELATASGELGVVEQGLLAPSCVHTSYDNNFIGFDTLRIRNTCAHGKRVKAVISFGRDSSCYFIRAGGTQKLRWLATPGKFDRLVRC